MSCGGLGYSCGGLGLLEVWYCRFFNRALKWGGVKCSLVPGFELPGGESFHLQVQAVCHHGTVAPHDPARQGGGGDGGDLAVEHVTQERYEAG